MITINNNPILIRDFIGPIGITDPELIKFEKIDACSVYFGLPVETRHHRPQVRPMFKKPYKDFESGKSLVVLLNFYC